MDKTIIWSKTRKILEEKISKTLLKIWFTQVELSQLSKNGDGFQVVLGCPNKFLAEQIAKRCGGVLISAFEQVLLEKVGVEFAVVDGKIETINLQKNDGQELDFGNNGKSQVFADFTFEGFVVGDSNRLAYSAAKAVCTSPGSLYNPLFIYGGTGLGKTHLLKAVAGKLASNLPNLKVSYKTTEAFTNEFVDSLAKGAIQFFREKYRKLDVLLIDDVQFLSGKPSTQDGFFHTFNELYATHHQIILTSDRHPQELGRVEERLVSRFLGGLTVDIAPPELELKMAILATKAKAAGLDLDGEVIEFLAGTVGNPREIEGVVAALCHFVKLGGNPELTAVKAVFTKKQPSLKVAPKPLISAVASFYGLRAHDLIGNVRKKPVVKARQMAMFLLRSELGLPYGFIGQLLGGRDHSTVIYGVSAIQKELGGATAARADVAEIKRGLTG